MSWVLAAVAVLWIIGLLLAIALCLSARRTDKVIFGEDDVDIPAIKPSVEPSAGVDDIAPAPRAVLKRPA